MITVKEILRRKKEEVSTLKRIKCIRNKKFYKLADFIKNKPFICEIKKSSPSTGEINKDIDKFEQAKIYEECGAGGISVLTDKNFFSGDIEELYEISRIVKLPILCKDFIINKQQIENAHISGADIILLIVSILDNENISSLTDYARNLNLEILFEIHNFTEFGRIEKLHPKYIGVNSRNLETMEIEKERAFETLEKLSETNGDFFKIAESGITSGDDIKYFRKAGADAFLIGTVLMKCNNVKKIMDEFYNCL